MCWHRLRFHSFAFAAVFSMALPSHAALSLDEAYQAALSRNETVAIERSRQTQTEARIDQAQGSVLPNLALNSSYSRQDPGGSSSSRTEQSSTRITLTQPLYSGGRDQAAIQAAQASLSAQEQTVAATRVLHRHRSCRTPTQAGVRSFTRSKPSHGAAAGSCWIIFAVHRRQNERGRSVPFDQA